jgi:hypothetical protein
VQPGALLVDHAVIVDDSQLDLRPIGRIIRLVYAKPAPLDARPNALDPIVASVTFPWKVRRRGASRVLGCLGRVGTIA